MNKLKNKAEYIIKHNLLAQKVYKVVASSLFRFIGLFIRIDENLILFNGHGGGYNDSPKEIFEYISKNEQYKSYKLVWALESPLSYTIPNCHLIKIDTFKYFIIALRAKYWVSSVNIERGLNFKRKETIYLNTWHGIPIKLVGNDAPKRNDYNFSNIDLFCYSGEYDKQIYIKSFNVSNQNLIKTGLPRNDKLFEDSSKNLENYKNKINLPKDKKIILYAPTWRDSIDYGNSYKISIPIDFVELEEELGEDYIVLLRSHAYTTKKNKVEFNSFLRDYTKYPNVNDLLLASDILISDYSAIIFDFSILEKPILCFGYDYQNYKNERGVYIDVESELPNGIIKGQEELVSFIKKMNHEYESNKTKIFKNKYIEVNGRATEKCVKKLLNH